MLQQVRSGSGHGKKRNITCQFVKESIATPCGARWRNAMKRTLFLMLLAVCAAMPVYAGEGTILESDTQIVVEYTGDAADSLAVLRHQEELVKEEQEQNRQRAEAEKKELARVEQEQKKLEAEAERQKKITPEIVAKQAVAVSRRAARNAEHTD
jgi:hypothetical protein